MCGILAIVNLKNPVIERDLVIRMRDTMVHRGPDDAGMKIFPSVALAHRRLSIIDLTPLGHQPMSNENDSVILVFNGEIYNYIELRENLIRKGHQFQSSTDSEVIIHQYEEDGPDCLKSLNGMFSFVILDRRKGEIFAARDRLGIKPFYYYHDPERFIAASEIKAILVHPDVRSSADPRGVSDYLFAGRALSGKTLFEGIRELEPGHYLRFDLSTGRLTLARYWDLEFNYDFQRDDERIINELAHLLDDSARIHSRSDAPLGCHLSGGLDSSTNVALISRHYRPLKTFSIKFSEDHFIDETKYAIAVAEHVGADYHEGRPTHLDLLQLLPKLVWAMDSPLTTDGGFAYYTVSNLAKDFVKVTVTGHGGDELFAGYPAQFHASFKRTDMFQMHMDPVRTIHQGTLNRLRKYLKPRTPGEYLKFIKRMIPGKDPSIEELWVSLHCGHLPGKSRELHSDLSASLSGYSPMDDYLLPFRNTQTDHALDKCLYHDLKVYLPALLMQEDRVSMSVSIESRVPLLDYRIAVLLATVPPEQKVREMKPKYLLRKVAESLLPDEVVNRRDKQPFPVPGKFWQTRELKEFTEKILLSNQSIGRGIFSKKFLLEAVKNNNLAWQALNLELWFRIFIDKDLEPPEL
jgi:asparagine synthase (glutamine-hydrolysing)